MEGATKENPLILVAYMDKMLCQNKEVMKILNRNMNDVIAAKEANIMYFIIPTDGEERMECINPTLLEKPDMDRVNKLVNDIAVQFDMGQGADEGKLDEIAEDEV